MESIQKRTRSSQQRNRRDKIENINKNTQTVLLAIKIKASTAEDQGGVNYPKKRRTPVGIKKLKVGACVIQLWSR